ncbi:MAG: protease pro-enzyme activation domain-containing protein [Terracidiphilus sp.]|jgi:hypothetical protein
MINSRSLPLCVLASVFLCSVAAPAQNVAPTIRIVNPIDESQLVTLKGNTHPAANAKNDRGPVSPGFVLPDLTLVLSRSPEQQAAFDAFVASQYDTGSPNYHQWLTPAQIGAQFGPAQADIATITGWLTSHGFTVKQVTPDRMTIRFGGTAAQVESTFHTQIHNLSVNGMPHYANMTDPQIPAAIAPVVVGVKALHNFLPHPLHRLGSMVQFDKATGKWERIVNNAAATSLTPSTSGNGSALTPLNRITAPRTAAAGGGVHAMFGINVPADPSAGESAYLEEDVTPYDFATIYNVTPLWNNGITGSGQTIAIAGTSEINLPDVTTYRSAFDLPAYTSSTAPQQIDTGDGPAATVCTSTSPYAVCGIGDLEENSLDVEASGAVATAAQIKLIVTGQNAEGTIDTVFDSSQYVVQNLTAKILSVSYGLCELGQGTSGNVAYYDLWQSAAAEGVSVFVATGDSGSPSCDQGGDEYGTPYTAQYGLTVSGMASTPYNTAVGGTDFSWCKPVLTDNGNEITGCPASSTAQGSSAYWNTSNNTSEGGESALGYVPEIPWNDTCENPIIASFLESFASQDIDVSAGTTPEEACSFVYNDWYSIYVETQGQVDISSYIDTAGGSGGASNCVVNSTNPDSENLGTCTTGSTTTGSTNGNITLANNGWPKPAWQQLGVTGTNTGDGVRDLPDVSFFAGNGALDSATLICVSALGACTYSDTSENFYQEVGGTSVGSPEMAGVMALIDQKSGGAQGLANPGLYSLALKQTYSSCSAETVKNTSSSCYFNDIDTGTNAMACDLPGGIEGGDEGEDYEGTPSPNCVAINSGDSVGTLVSSGTTPAFNGAVGYDMATGLGSLNVANVVNAWISDLGTASSTMGVTLNPTGTISAGTSLAITVTITGSGSLAAPTGSIVVSGGGYSATGMLTAVTPATKPASSTATITIPPSSLSPGSVTLTLTYSGDSDYASINTTKSVTVSAVTPTVTVNAPATDNVVNAVLVTVAISGPAGAPAATGDVSLAQTSNCTTNCYSSTAATLNSSGAATFTIPANSLNPGSDVLTATYNGSANYYSSGTGTATVDMVSTALLTPTISVTPTPATIDSSQTLNVSVTVTGSSGAGTGTVTLTAGSYTSIAEPLVSGGATFTVPSNSLSSGTATVTASYSGDATYASGSGKGNVTVTKSIYSLAATAPAAVSPPSSSTSTITGTTSSTDYTGVVTLNSCALTSSSVTNPNSPPTCSVTGTITYVSGTATGSGTATIFTTAASTSGLVRPEPAGKGWLGAGSGAVLAFLVFLGIPARRRSWRATLGMVVLLAVLGSLSACGGSSGTTTTTTPGTSAGTYTFTVSGTGNDPASTVESTTFVLTVN